MNQTREKIRQAVQDLSAKPNEIRSGTVVAGSLDAAANTCSVLLTGEEKPIFGVLLTPSSGNQAGVIIHPADNSSIVVGSADGGGEWFVVAATNIVKATIAIDNASFEMTADTLKITNGSMLWQAGSGAFKVNAATESLYAILHDLISYITVLTVPTSSGPSGVPTNITDFATLLTRLGNVLSA
jgi:hypothetical protein